LCSGGTYTFPDGDTSSTSTIHTSNLLTVDGCDSIIVSTLTVGTTYVISETVIMCNGEVYTFGDGSTSTTATIHVSYLLGVGGCDSMVTTNLTVTIVDTAVTEVGNVLLAASADTYQWLVCQASGDLSIGGQTSQSYTVTINAAYKVALTKDGCKDTSSCRVMNIISILENTIGSELLVFPNPATDHLVIDFGALYKSSLVQIMDMQGKILQYFTGEYQRQVEMDIHNLAQGMYLVKVHADDQGAMIKLIVE